MFAPSTIFDEIFRDKCCKVIEAYTVQKEVQTKFVVDIQKELNRLVLEMTCLANPQSSVSVHQRQLVLLRPHISQLKSNKTCLVCLFRMPEKVLVCDHYICGAFKCCDWPGRRWLCRRHPSNCQYLIGCSYTDVDCEITRLRGGELLFHCIIVLLSFDIYTFFLHITKSRVYMYYSQVWLRSPKRNNGSNHACLAANVSFTYSNR